MGNSGYSAGSPPHATARGKGWVSKMDADTKEGNTDDECCDRTEGGGLQNGVFFGCYHCTRDPITERQRMIGVCNFLPKRKVTKVP